MAVSKLMHTRLLLLLSLLFASMTLSTRVTNPKKVPKNAVLLPKVSALTVRAGKQTTSRRVSPIPQLQCVGPTRVCSLYSIDVMRCSNEGSDYDEGNVQWSCKASLPEEFKLGSTEVTCEGYESSEDPFVLKGSCGVQYRLLLTDKGEEKYGTGSWFDSGSSSGGQNKGEKLAGYLFMALFALVLFIIARGIYTAWRNDAPRPRPRGGGGFGGFGGGGDDNDPPPPYDPRPPPRPKKATWSSASSSRAGASSAGRQDQGWRPGFWTGTAAGAAAGYFAGRGARQPAPQPAQPAFGGGWFGGGDRAYAAPTRPSPPSTRTPSYSSSRHESTGFGGTSRR